MNKDQYGNQPIRVLVPRLISAFQVIKNELSLSYNLGDVNLNLICVDKKAEGPFSTEHVIQIHDTFLSFIWSYTYGILVTAPMGDKNLTKEEYEEASALLKYALTLLTDYKVWDKELLPNPELENKNKNRLIGITNVCHFYAFIYILYHEFAHIALGHIERLDRAKTAGFDLNEEERFEMESEADLFALKILEKTKVTNHKWNAVLGIISALSSLTFTSKKVSGGKYHPDPDHRIKAVLEKIDPPNSDYSWGFAFWTLITWEKEFYKTGRVMIDTLDGTSDTKDFKSVFYNSLKSLDNLKNK